jgi:hypothetical protein
MDSDKSRIVFKKGDGGMKEEIYFLKELQQELKTQENDGQAAPRFWSIMDYKWDVTEEGHEDRISLFDVDCCETIELDEYVNEIVEGERNSDFTEEEIEELKDRHEYDSPSDVIEWIKEFDDEDRYYLIYEKEISFIAWNTLFFTKKEARQHLESNRHHYSNKAHTFAMTAWRAPKMERLMKILESFDWDSIVKWLHKSKNSYRNEVVALVVGEIEAYFIIHQYKSENGYDAEILERLTAARENEWDDAFCSLEYDLKEHLYEDRYSVIKVTSKLVRYYHYEYGVEYDEELEIEEVDFELLL